VDSKNWLNFGSHLHLTADPGVCWKIRSDFFVLRKVADRQENIHTSPG